LRAPLSGKTDKPTVSSGTGTFSYWQATMPYGREFAAIDIPVLMTTGYYDGGEIGALMRYDCSI
jgi:hypothetical protein